MIKSIVNTFEMKICNKIYTALSVSAIKKIKD